MRVALFFDGKNFYSGWRDAAAGQRIDFVKLSSWLVERVGGSSLWSANYYTGVDEHPADGQDGALKLNSFLDVLESQPGFFVYRFTRRGQRVTCQSCGAENRLPQDKELDTTMVADMVRLAAVGAFDVMVLMSGDSGYAPAIESVRSLGRQAYIASWGGAGVSQRIRRAAFDHIDLLEGMPVFEREPKGEDERTIDLDSPEELERAQGIFLSELATAEEKFNGGYVGLGYFVTKWRSSLLDPNPDVRRRLVDELAGIGKLEIYEAPDGAQAIRSLI